MATRRKALPALKRFTVRVDREIRHHAEVEVEATDEEHAKDLAAEQYDGPQGGGFWREGDVIDQTITVKETK